MFMSLRFLLNQSSLNSLPTFPLLQHLLHGGIIDVALEIKAVVVDLRLEFLVVVVFIDDFDLNVSRSM